MLTSARISLLLFLIACGFSFISTPPAKATLPDSESGSSVPRTYPVLDEGECVLNDLFALTARQIIQHCAGISDTDQPLLALVAAERPTSDSPVECASQIDGTRFVWHQVFTEIDPVLPGEVANIDETYLNERRPSSGYSVGLLEGPNGTLAVAAIAYSETSPVGETNDILIPVAVLPEIMHEVITDYFDASMLITDQRAGNNGKPDCGNIVDCLIRLNDNRVQVLRYMAVCGFGDLLAPAGECVVLCLAACIGGSFILTPGVFLPCMGVCMGFCGLPSAVYVWAPCYDQAVLERDEACDAYELCYRWKQTHCGHFDQEVYQPCR